MKRLVLFAPEYHEGGGIGRRCRLLVSAFANRGWEVRVVSRSVVCGHFRLTRSPNEVVLEVPAIWRGPLGTVLFLLVAVPLALVWGARAEAMLAIQLVSPTTAAVLSSAVLRRPCVAMATTSGPLSEAAYLSRSRLAPVRKLLLRRASFVAAQTDAVAEELRGLVGPERVVVVPNPVVPVVAPPLNGERRALYTGRLTAGKDLHRLLEAWRVVAGEQPGAMLTLAGDGGRYAPVESELRELVRDDSVLRATVRFTGWVADVTPLLAEADVYVFPSLSEGMSNALLEACAWGRVVVASDIPANKAVVGDDYPLLFRAGDTESLVETLQRAFDDEVSRVRARECLASRIRAHSVDAVVDRLEELIGEAARRPRH